MTEQKKIKTKTDSKEKIKPKAVTEKRTAKAVKPKPQVKLEHKLKVKLKPAPVKEQPVVIKAPAYKRKPPEKKKEYVHAVKEAPEAEVKKIEPVIAEVEKIIPPVQVTPVKEIKPAKVIIHKPELKEETPIIKPAAPEAVEVPQKELELNLPILVKDLAVKLQEKPSLVIKSLVQMGIMAAINQSLDEAAAVKICQKYGFKIKLAPSKEDSTLSVHTQVDAPESLKHRSPIVTLMGHVDHGKTSLLDAIRKSKVVDTEHGGITQHIGAYRVKIPHGDITFLDTPGHEAFTAMRARGARITDIVVLVVAADEGIMPQTQEAIDHAKAAGVTIMVAINKIDKPQADIDRVKKQLEKLELVPEDWGGKTITVPVSAKTGQGIDNLLEMILLEAQMLELKANPDKPARGVVIEAKSHKYRGPIVTLLIQNGTLHLNQNIIVGKYNGKIRAMFNDGGQAVITAGPSIPVEVMGISGLPQAGEQFFVVEDEKSARELALKRQEQERAQQQQPVKRMGLEDLYTQIKEGKLKELKLIIKADAHGSLEAIKDVIGKIEVEEITLSIIHEGVGNINVSDVILAVASEALILGFNVVADDNAKEMIAKEGQEVRTYNIIYELANDIRAALEGMLEPKYKKVFVGKVEIRKVFKLSRSGTIAGCFVAKGKIVRSNSVRLLRNGEQVYEGELSSLKRFKDDVREVAEGYECGIALKGFDNILEGDVIEAFQLEKIARKL